MKLFKFFFLFYVIVWIVYIRTYKVNCLPEENICAKFVMIRDGWEAFHTITLNCKLLITTKYYELYTAELCFCGQAAGNHTEKRKIAEKIT